MDTGTFETDEHGRKMFRPGIPVFPPLEDVHDLLDKTLHPLREFDRLVQEWRHPGSVGRLFARLDAVHSSGAEGSTTTFTDLMEFETSLGIAPDVDDADTVSACAEAFDTEADGSADLNAMVLRIHQRLFGRAKNKMAASGAGKFKTKPNFTRDPDFPGNFFGYTSPGSVAAALQEWQDFTLATDPKTPELVRQMLSHWMFEHIHPVTDGNGRIGRLLVPIAMKLKGQTGTACTFFGEAVYDDKQLYVDALKDARMTGQTAAFTRQMLGFVMTTARANLDRLRRLAALETEWKRGVSARADSAVHLMIPYALTKPVFTVSDAQKDLGTKYVATNNAAKALLDAGILSVPADARRDRLFHANEVLEIFDRFRPQPSPRPGGM